MNEKRKSLYEYLSGNGMTDLSYDDFSTKYASDPERFSSLYNYLKGNNLTDLDEAAFKSSYFGDIGQKKSGGEESVSAGPSTSQTSTPLGGRMMSSPEGRWAGGIGMFSQQPQQPAAQPYAGPYTVERSRQMAMSPAGAQPLPQVAGMPQIRPQATPQQQAQAVAREAIAAPKPVVEEVISRNPSLRNLYADYTPDQVQYVAEAPQVEYRNGRKYFKGGRFFINDEVGFVSAEQIKGDLEAISEREFAGGAPVTEVRDTEFGVGEFNNVSDSDWARLLLSGDEKALEYITKLSYEDREEAPLSATPFLAGPLGAKARVERAMGVTDQQAVERRNAARERASQISKSVTEELASFLPEASADMEQQLTEISNEVGTAKTTLATMRSSGQITEQQYQEQLKYLDDYMDEVLSSDQVVRIRQLRKTFQGLSAANAFYDINETEGSNAVKGLINSFLGGWDSLERGLASGAFDGLTFPAEVMNALAAVTPFGPIWDDMDEGLTQNAREAFLALTSSGFESSLGFQSQNERAYLESIDSPVLKVLYEGATGLAGSLPAMAVPGGIGFFAQTYGSSYDEAIEQGLTPTEAKLYATTQGLVAGALEKYGLSNLLKSKSVIGSLTTKSLRQIRGARGNLMQALDAAINREVKGLLPTIAKRTVQGFLAEAETGGLQTIAEGAIKAATNFVKQEQIFSPEDINLTASSIFQGALLEGIGGLYMGTLNILSGKERHNFQGFSETQFEQLRGTMRPSGRVQNQYLNYLAQLYKNGEITAEELDRRRRNYVSVRDSFAQVPKEYSNRDAAEAVDLIQEKQRLTEAMKSVPTSAAARYQARITEIDNRLKEIDSKYEGAEPATAPEEAPSMGTQEREELEQPVPEEVEEEITVGEDELSQLEAEVQREEDQGTLADNIGQKAYRNGEEGMIMIDPENENTIVFETNTMRYELGNKDEVGGELISDRGLSLMPPEGVQVVEQEAPPQVVEADGKAYRVIPEGETKFEGRPAQQVTVDGQTYNAVEATQEESQQLPTDVYTIDGKKYKIVGRRRDKKGKAVVRVKEVDTGLDRRLVGEKAERILKDEALRKEAAQQAPLPLQVEGKERVAAEPAVETKEQSKQRVAEEKAKLEQQTEQELAEREAAAEKAVAEFEDAVLEEMAAKETNKDLVQVKGNIYQVTKKDDGTFSVTKMRADGKLIRISDANEIRQAVAQFKRAKTVSEKKAFADAQRMIEQAKAEEQDKILEWLDGLIKGTSAQGRAFDATIGLPLAAVNTSLKIIRAAYKAGKSLAEAIQDGIRHLKQQGYAVNEREYKKYVLDQLKPKKDAVQERETAQVPVGEQAAAGPEVGEEVREQAEEEVAPEEEMPESEKPTAKETEMAEALGVSARNWRDLYKIYREVFGLNKIKSFSAMIVSDRMIEAMAARDKISKEQMYAKIKFRKGNDAFLRKATARQKALYQMFGRKAQLTQQAKDNYIKAEQLYRELGKAGMEKIRVSTGWMLGSDNEWRYEMPPDLVLQPNGGEVNDQRIVEFAERLIDGETLTLGDLYPPDSRLLKSYPSMKDVKIRIKPIGGRAQYSPSTNTITFDTVTTLEFQDLIEAIQMGAWEQLQITKADLTGMVSENPAATLMGTLVHEVQHVIQKIEGFSFGTTPSAANTWFEMNLSSRREVIDNLSDKVEELQQTLDDYGPDAMTELILSETKKRLATEKRKFEQLKNKYAEGKAYMSPDEAQKMYELSYGEAEARNAANRMLLTEMERRLTPLSDTMTMTDGTRISEEDLHTFFQGDAGAMVAEDGQYIIYALSSPNVSTPLHEIAHVFEHYLTEAERSNILKWAGHSSWTMETSEKFARGFERFLADGNAPSSSLAKIFSKFKEWLTDIYNGIVGSDIDFELNDSMKDIYSKMLGENWGTKAKVSATIRNIFPRLFRKNGTLTNKNDYFGQKAEFWAEFKRLKFYRALQVYRNKTVSDFFENPIKNLIGSITTLDTLINFMDGGKGTFFRDNIYVPLQRATEAQKKGKRIQLRIFDDIANSIDGIEDGFKTIKRMLAGSEIRVENINFSKSKNRYFSKDEMLRIYALWQNEGQRKKLIRQGISAATIEEIKGVLGEKLVSFADGIVEHLSTKYYEQTNAVYKKLNGKDLPKEENYFPTLTISNIETEIPVDKDFFEQLNAEWQSALKDREDVSSEVLLKASFTMGLIGHVNSMEHYKAFGETARSIDEVMNVRATGVWLRTLGVEKLVRERIARTLNPNSPTAMKSPIMAKLFNNFSGFVLAYKMIQIPKQAASFVMAYTDYEHKGPKGLGFLSFLYDYARVVSKFPKYNKMMRELSATYDDRILAGLAGEYYQLESGQAGFTQRSLAESRRAEVLRKLKSMGGRVTVLGDALGVAGYMANFIRDIENGMSVEDAVTKFNYYDATQQPQTELNRIPLSSADKWGIIRTITMFASSVFAIQNQAIQATTGITRALRKSVVEKQELSPEERKDLKKQVKRLVFSVGLNNMLFATMQNISLLIAGDDEDREKALIEIGKAALGVSMFERLPIVGEAITEIWNAVSGEDPNPFASQYTNPIVDIFREVYRDIVDKEYLRAAKTIAEAAIGTNVDPVIGMYNAFALRNNLTPLLPQKDETPESATYEALGISKSYRPAVKKKKKRQGASLEELKRYSPELYEEMKNLREEIKPEEEVDLDQFDGYDSLNPF